MKRSGSLEGYFLLSWTAALEEGPKNDSAAGPEPLQMGEGQDASSVASGQEDPVRHPLAHTASHTRIKACHPQSPTTTDTGSEGPEHWP